MGNSDHCGFNPDAPGDKRGSYPLSPNYDMMFWECTSIGFSWLRTRPAEWRATTCSNALDSVNTRQTASSVVTASLGVKWSRN
ncbi:hypothetical protein TNCV_2101721 [Trichonephila clavipes]|nr:hypothetical protein TNCV_2101721 [Trichonephila clavipes]